MQNSRTVERVERTHWMDGGRQLLVRSAAQLKRGERSKAPAALRDMLDDWPGALSTLPPGLEWCRDTLRARSPLLECSDHGGRVYWTLRFPLYGDADRVKGECFGSRGSRMNTGLPDELGWLAETFGTVDLCSEWSGSAPWGMRLRDVPPERMFDGVREALPAGADDWAVLYEADGDWVLADLATGEAHWVGGEWTGMPDVVLGVPWRPVLRFVLWRLLDGGFVRPSDLAMLCGP